MLLPSVNKERTLDINWCCGFLIHVIVERQYMLRAFSVKFKEGIENNQLHEIKASNWCLPIWRKCIKNSHVLNSLKTVYLLYIFVTNKCDSKRNKISIWDKYKSVSIFVLILLNVPSLFSIFVVPKFDFEITWNGENTGLR